MCSITYHSFVKNTTVEALATSAMSSFFYTTHSSRMRMVCRLSQHVQGEKHTVPAPCVTRNLKQSFFPQLLDAAYRGQAIGRPRIVRDSGAAYLASGHKIAHHKMDHDSSSFPDDQAAVSKTAGRMNLMKVACYCCRLARAKVSSSFGR